MIFDDQLMQLIQAYRQQAPTWRVPMNTKETVMKINDTAAVNMHVETNGSIVMEFQETKDYRLQLTLTPDQVESFVTAFSVALEMSRTVTKKKSKPLPEVAP